MWRKVAILWLCSLPLLAATRARVWSDEAWLWRDAHDKAPRKVRPIVNLGNASATTDPVLAAFFYEQARAVSAHRPPYERDTGWAIATTNLAVVKTRMGDYEAGRSLIRTVRQRFPAFAEAQRLAEQIDR